MIVRLAGLDFLVEPDERVSPEERAALARLAEVAAVEGGISLAAATPPWRVRIEARSPAGGQRTATPPDGSPAAVSAEGRLVRLAHERFEAEIEPDAGVARHMSSGNRWSGLEITLRAALSCRLPLEGGLPFHAAAVTMNGKGLVFFGPSGAGKTTISRLSPHPVLSDELVALRPDGTGRYHVSSTGFWGELGNRTAPPGFFPLAGLFELEKGAGPRLTRLKDREALLRLLGVVMIPASAALWKPAMAVLRSLLESVPVYRLTWSPEASPWETLEAAVREAPTA